MDIQKSSLSSSNTNSGISLLDYFKTYQDEPLLQSRLSQTKKDWAKLAAINVVGLACLGVLVYALAEAYQAPHLNNRVILVCQMAAAGVLRALIEGNSAVLNHSSEPTVVNHIMNWSTRYCFYLYEILWNASLNTTNPTALQVLMSLRQALIGFTITGDLALFLQRNRTHRIDLDLTDERPIVNRLIEPDYNSRGQIPYYGACVALGVVMITAGYLLRNQVPGIELFSTSLGLYLTSSWMGYGGMHCLAKLWRHLEVRQAQRFTQQVDDGGVVGLPQVPWYLRLTRETFKSIHGGVLEGMCILPALIHPAPLTFPLIGVGYGAMEWLALRKFQTLQIQDRETILQERYAGDPSKEVTRLAVRVNQVTTALFFVLYTSFFAYGLATSGVKEDFEITALLTATLAMGIIGRVLYSLFKPEKNGRLMNQAVYRILENPYNLLILYQAISQLTSISNQALSQASPFVYFCGVIGQALFGTLIALDQTRPYQVREVTTPIFDALAIQEVIFDWINNGSG